MFGPESNSNRRFFIIARDRTCLAGNNRRRDDTGFRISPFAGWLRSHGANVQMSRQVVIGFATIGAILATGARADVIVTLKPMDTDMNPIVGSVPAGATVIVDILVSTDGDEGRVEDVQLFQFDFGATSPAIELGAFTWLIDPDAYPLRLGPMGTPPLALATSFLSSSDPGLVSLDAEPVRVAVIEVTVNGNGTLNIIGSTDIGQTSRASIDAGFSPRVSFSLAAGNLTGGTFQFVVGEAPEPGNDGDPAEPEEDNDGDGIVDSEDPGDDNDGVEDTDDDVPPDPAETTDSDGAGVGDNADAGSLVVIRLCGVAMMGTSVFILWGLAAIRLLFVRAPYAR